jgi:hypothetical protein
MLGRRVFRLFIGAAIVAATVAGLGQVANAATTNTKFGGYDAALASGNQRVSASFVVPTVTCPATGNRGLAIVVGLAQADHVGTSEGGLFAVCQQGGLSLFPVAFSGQTSCQLNDPVSSGDHMSASVVRTGNNVTVTVKDTTQSWQRVCTGVANTTDTRAQIGIGDLTINGPLAPLAKFSSLRFTACRVSGATLGSRSKIQFTKVSPSNVVQATTGPVSSTGLAFTETWKHQ